jgi:hypothetical protein
MIRRLNCSISPPKNGFITEIRFVVRQMKPLTGDRCRRYTAGSPYKKWTPIVGQSYKCILPRFPIVFLEPVLPAFALRMSAVDVSHRAGEKSAF